MSGKGWVRTCAVEWGGTWSNEPIPMFGANDGPGGEASIRSPDVCKMVARVIKRWGEHGPLWVTACTKTLKWCTGEALHYHELFPDWFSTSQAAIRFISECCSNQLEPTCYLNPSHVQLFVTVNNSTYLFFLVKLHFCYVTMQMQAGTVLTFTPAGHVRKFTFSHLRKRTDGNCLQAMLSRRQMASSHSHYENNVNFVFLFYLKELLFSRNYENSDIRKLRV